MYNDAPKGGPCTIFYFRVFKVLSWPYSQYWSGLVHAREVKRAEDQTMLPRLRFDITELEAPTPLQCYDTKTLWLTSFPWFP